MARISTARQLGVLGFLLCGTTAQADVTAQQVWDNWSEQMAIYGQGFTTGGETTDGDTLTVSDVEITMSDEEASLTTSLGDINLTENGDGTVSVTIAESYPAVIELTPELGDPSTINLAISQTGMVLTVSGEPEAMIYDIVADRYALSVDSLEGGANEEVTLDDATFAMNGLSGHYSVIKDNLTRVSYKFGLETLDLNVLFTETDGEDVVKATAGITDIVMFSDIVLPLDLDLDADYPPFDAGLALEGGYSFGNLNYAFNIDVDDEAASGRATVEAGELGFLFDYDQLTFTGGSRGLDVSLSIPNEIPFPIEAAMARYGYDFNIPLSQGDGEPRDARFAFNLTDLAVSNSIWNLLDPQGILPRDTLTVALGLNAQVTPFFDVLDPDQQEALALTDVPGEVHGVELTDLTVRAAGAEVTGSGAFTFDNSDLESFEGFPRPEGKADFALNGANGLIDKLIDMGLIPEDQALVPRLMLGMFATSVGDDMLTATIEVNSEGHVLANGQRLR